MIISKRPSGFADLSYSKKILLVLAELLILAGQFLPLKAVLVIYSERTPAFLAPVLGEEYDRVAVVLFGFGILFFGAGKLIMRVPRLSEARRENYLLAPSAFLGALVLSPSLAVVGLLLILLHFLAWLSLFRLNSDEPFFPWGRFTQISRELSPFVSAAAALIAATFFSWYFGIFGVLGAALLINRLQRELIPLRILYLAKCAPVLPGQPIRQ